MQFSATCRKRSIYISQKFLFLVTKKDSENKKLPSKWTPFASLVFSLLHSISICPLYLQTTSFKLITYCLSSSAFIFLTLIFFLSNQDQASALKVAYIFKVFRAQSCLMVAQQFDQFTYVCDEYSNFQGSKSIFMISDFKIFPIMLLKQLNCGLPKKNITVTFLGFSY